jgi:hypothetical protein
MYNYGLVTTIILIQDAQTHFSNYTLERTSKNVYPQDKKPTKTTRKGAFSS